MSQGPLALVQWRDVQSRYRDRRWNDLLEAAEAVSEVSGLGDWSQGEVNSLKFCWEQLHLGEWHAVDPVWRGVSQLALV